ncbi:MAG: hypothetical protein A3I38_00605 [Candidatus Wildermuthbacteria bacterium RIFCSPLOWO2_02_FULL_47_10]|uniref:LemA family protein n=1 Tax=Candidatus Wildermuthbacteria bacterium RIFCSPLOWO2_01_FULL_48_35 TaxID=1802463 RepID=A0A1G2RTT2_9BACT|nr:MAG: hypothetical protein A3A32_00180 [Candidatus Wildermuthbacteria bacterium RIFCSPLOWO2_01_FULL_48_35]OHA76632.1 MAG: hypothetical protein A3I38_00605 [Candidatus Wildermuthbacteria bacterium RIFCSPLOWO2_02_FULL_47_10]
MHDDPSVGKIIWYSILGIVGVLVLWIVLASAIWGFGVATAGIFGRGEAHKQIQSAANRIQAYDHFFNKCAAIQAGEARIDALLKEQKLYEPGSGDFARVSSSLTGVIIARHESIVQYNADASKDYTIGQFRDSDLPYQIPNTEYPEGGKARCNFGTGN